MEKRQRVCSSSYSSAVLQNRLLPVLIACGALTSITAPAQAQYQYMQGSMMGMGAATGLIRTVPMMTTGLVRALIPHRSHKNKNKNNNNLSNGTNGSGQTYAPNNTTQGQAYSGSNGQPVQTLTAPVGQYGYNNNNNNMQNNNMQQAQSYPMPNAQPNAQPAYNSTPGLVPQNGQNAYATVQGQMYNAPGQAAYGMQGAPAAYGPGAGQ